MKKSIFPILNLIYKGPFRGLCLLLALLLAASVFWDPTQFAAATSSLKVWQGLFLIWAVCSGVVHGIGFTSKKQDSYFVIYPWGVLIVLLCGFIYLIFTH